MAWMEKYVNFDTSHHPRAYVNSLVRFHHTFTTQQRLAAAEKAGWNVFQFPSEMLLGGDLLSDSGTTTLTSEQLANMILGDEAYGTNYGYPLLLNAFAETFGLNLDHWEIFLFHQGRAAENTLFTQLGKLVEPNSIIPSNGHFDTTHANIEANKISAVNLFSDELGKNPTASFSGNMNITDLKELLRQSNKQIPLVYATITNNTGGGQPVALQNLQDIRALCDDYGKPFFLDACRFAENAYYIKHREDKYKNSSITEIVHTMFGLSDGFTMSLKKDGLSNIGGALFVKKESVLTNQYPHLLNNLRDYQILTEGHPTYGGMTGRDIMVLVEGLKTVVQAEYLHSRISQVQQFGDYLAGLGIPLVKPFGGHAIYIDVDQFFQDTEIQREDFGGIALTGLLLLKGVRLCELGAFAFGKYDPATTAETFPIHNYVRCAVPRNKYEIQDLYYVADCVKGLYDQRKSLPRAIPVYGRDLSLRHFKAKFELRSI